MAGFFMYALSVAKPRFQEPADIAKGNCSVCGAKDTDFAFDQGINDDLARQWELSERQRFVYSARETRHCGNCRASLRARLMADAIIDVFAPGSGSLEAAIASKKMDGLKIAEINANNFIHDRLAKLPGVTYSEYKPADPSIRHENIEKLSYKDREFDAVLTAETLEHIPNYQKALAEIKRVLKPGGVHIFTIPMLFSRHTRRRVEVAADGSLKQILEASYHGAGEPDNLVCTEFGIDVLDELKTAGFTTKIFYANPLSRDSVNCVFISHPVQ